ncbi:unnamed protein product [Plutella xylostella]|uniref:(diamondback moth) hypothetical protein n=1 Tax=Plutella xylostella TaxID=51655 RepID=A0A8S4EVB9_PLUXY|nr:unnamed protein product [Plutella xylostella]
MHGLLDSSDSFIIAGPEAGLAYRLADACHDVWCPNHRGNRYSRNHLTLNHEEDPAYWNFSYDEHGTRDLPAIVDYVLNNTAATSINYLGHSQGTTDFFILNSVRPDYNRKFNLAICLAPVAWLYHLFSPLLRLLAKYEREIGATLRAVGVYELLGRNQPIPDKLLELFCQYIPEVLCGSTFFLVTGVNPSNIRRDILRGIVGHYPSASSVKNLLHFAQAVNVNSFRRFDYESEGANMAVYGTTSPPEYNVTNVIVRVALLRGEGDFLVSMQDVDTLYSQLPNVIDYYVMPEKDWSHFDFVWGKRIPDQLLPKVFEYLDLYAA